jgi:hemolysin activation/secretion protein
MRDIRDTGWRPRWRSLVGAAVLSALAPAGLAQQALDPYDLRRLDGGVFAEGERRVQDFLKPRARPAKTIIRADMPRHETSLSSLKLSIKGFLREGHPDIDQAGLDRVLAPWKDRELSFPEFEAAVHAAARYLRETGHPNAEVKISRLLVGDGAVAVAIQGLTPSTRVAENVTPRIQIKSFRFTGVTVASDEELQKVVADWAEKEMTVKEMEQPAEAVAAYLRTKGYTLAQAYLPPQRIDTGVLEIAVQEGIVDGTAGQNGLTVAGADQRIKPEVIAEMLSPGIKPGQPFRAADIEAGLLAANDLPGIKSVRANLVPGSQPGTTQVQAQVEEGNLLSGAVWADNYGSVLTGEGRLNTVINVNSPTGRGEQVSFSGTTASGMRNYKIAASAPVGVSGARVGASYSGMEMELGRQFAPLNLDSESYVYSAYGTYPIERGAERNTYASLNLDYKGITNDLQGFRSNDRKTTSATLAFNGDLLDPLGGRMNWGALFTAGDLDLSGNPNNQTLDSVTARTGGSFTKTNWNMARLASIGDLGTSWYLGLSGQFASKNLDPGEKFQLGGPSGVRAYPIGEGLGDEGYLANLELRQSFGSTPIGDAQIFGFMDAGRITQYKEPWPNFLAPGAPNTYSLSGYGLGAELSSKEHGNVRLSWARKSGNNPNPTATGTDSDGTKKDSRVWIIGTFRF